MLGGFLRELVTARGRRYGISVLKDPHQGLKASHDRIGIQPAVVRGPASEQVREGEMNAELT